jgi:hypothetical protein
MHTRHAVHAMCVFPCRRTSRFVRSAAVTHEHICVPTSRDPDAHSGRTSSALLLWLRNQSRFAASCGAILDASIDNKLSRRRQ